MSSSEDLQRAVQAARAGRKVEARDLLLKIVEVDPRNEMAWMWLSGVVDSLEDRIIACENVLTINPTNEKVLAYLMKLQSQRETKPARKNSGEAANLLHQAKVCAERNDITAAVRLAWQALEKQDTYEDAWLFIAKISPDLDQQIAALEKAYKLNPSNTEAASALKQARDSKANPMRAAQQLEQAGEFEEALKVYQGWAARTKNSRDFDQIYRQIIRIEGLQKEKIRYVAPTSSIARLTFGWPLLYISLALVQMGLNPFAHPTFYLWLGLPLVVVGSFLLSLAEVRSNHILWQKIFGEQGDGSQFARLIAATAGWFLVIVPHLLIILDSLNRLRNFHIPPKPF